MDPHSFKTVHASVRPARVAILIDSGDPEWQHTCLRIIEFYSRLWGGAYNLIVPTDGAEIDERFWTLLESFDPDYIFRYQKTLDDLALSHADRYSEILEKRVDEFVARSGGDRDVARREIDTHLRESPTSPFEISGALQEEVKRRLAPFWFKQWVVDAQAIRASSTPPFHLTDVTKIIPSTEHTDRIGVIEVTEGLLPTLWYVAVTGLMNSATAAAFKQLGIQTETLAFGEDNVSQLIDFATGGELGRSATRDLNIVPFRVNMLQLGLFRSLRYEHWRERVVVVVGSTIQDFCLYYCLSRMRDRVVWVLPSITEKITGSNTDARMSRVEMSFLFSLTRVGLHTSQNEGGLDCITCSLDSNQVDRFVLELGKFGLGIDNPDVGKIDDVGALVRFPVSAFERDNFQRDIFIQLSDHFSVSPFATPKPKHFQPIHPYEHRYVTQLSIVGESPPKHPELGVVTIPDNRLSTSEARVGKEGPAYFCPSIAYFGGDIDTVLVKPRLYLPPLHRIVERLAEIQGYQCRRSDKGIYADESISKWGGLAEIGEFLRNTEHRTLLDRFLDISKSEPGKGVYLADDRRRYLAFGDIAAVVGKEAASLVDELVSKQIVYRGFIFGCSYCRNVSWFSVSDVTQEFKCRRCGRSQVYTKRNWKMPDEPAWYYKLDELIYQGYRQGMAISLLALNYLKAESDQNFSFTTDREFWRPEGANPEVEADFFCTSDGVFTVGEAKKENTLGTGPSEENAKINKYALLAKRLGLRQVVFATLSECWRSQTVDAVSAAFKELGGVRIVFLAASEIL